MPVVAMVGAVADAPACNNTAQHSTAQHSTAQARGQPHTGTTPVVPQVQAQHAWLPPAAAGALTDRKLRVVTPVAGPQQS
jgi:hypothetical protein